MCGHKWTDETSYSQRQKEKKPHLWMARIAGMRLFVRRYTSGIYWTAHCYNPEHAEWSISVPTDTPEEAIAVAVADTARWLRSLADAVEVNAELNGGGK